MAGEGRCGAPTRASAAAQACSGSGSPESRNVADVTSRPCAGTASVIANGIDGVIFESAGRRATFLPQVWEELPDPHEFMAQLKQKAGFPSEYWAADVKLQRYGAVKMKD